MQQSAVAFNSYLENVRGFAWSNFRDFEFQKFVQSMGSNPDALSKYTGDFTIYVNDNPIVWSITVDQLNGFSLRAGNAIPDMLPEEKARIARIAIEASGKGVWVPSTIYGLNADQMEQTLTFAQAIRSISLTSPGPIIGVMMYNLSFYSLDQWFKKVEGDQSNRTYIVKATDGTIVHSLVPAERGESLLSPADLKSVKKAKGGHFYSKRDFGSALVLYEKLERSDWMLVTMMPVKLLIKPVNDFTKSTLLFGSLSLLFSMLLAGVFYSRTITPLKELSKGMKAIEVGNYKVSLPVRSYDELGYITSSFNRMAKEINRLIMKVYESEIIKKNAEIKSLQSQINPHFLYNTLGIIDSLSAIDGDARISFISRSLAKMFRYNISGEDISTMGGGNSTNPFVFVYSEDPVRREIRLFGLRRTGVGASADSEDASAADRGEQHSPWRKPKPSIRNRQNRSDKRRRRSRAGENLEQRHADRFGKTGMAPCKIGRNA
ncbi:histidine kinase [Cohnella rhizosphaerae]|uniref:Histidine kinase n=1 Tax=Cohnella rhizosphaerae TaxID=1457232 RepID=A0A9X4QVP5_9BACL|nr:sensor histidine kinase [Cohnella rhizosphaerae]MDG0812789.1 histidine kinase [Cohnella rhizosphaerae]